MTNTTIINANITHRFEKYNKQYLVVCLSDQESYLTVLPENKAKIPAEQTALPVLLDKNKLPTPEQDYLFCGIKGVQADTLSIIYLSELYKELHRTGHRYSDQLTHYEVLFQHLFEYPIHDELEGSCYKHVYTNRIEINGVSFTLNTTKTIDPVLEHVVVKYALRPSGRIYNLLEFTKVYQFTPWKSFEELLNDITFKDTITNTLKVLLQ